MLAGVAKIPNLISVLKTNEISFLTEKISIKHYLKLWIRTTHISILVERFDVEFMVSKLDWTFFT